MNDSDGNTVTNNDLNLRAMLGAYMLGTGGTDIANLMLFIGIPGGIAFERAF